MSSWFSRVRAPKPNVAEESDKLQVPGGLWTKCPSCTAIVYTRELVRNLMVCTKCDYHFRIQARQRITLLTDRHSFEEFDNDLKTNDPLNFKDSKKYKDRLKDAEKKSEESDAIITGRAKLDGRSFMLGVFNFSFMGGSMGLVVGEKLTRMVEKAYEENVPAVILSASGGARMQEGIFSLMQMAKVSAALERLGQKGLPYISILCDPTTGGVAASFAMLGDVIIAEPQALIGFAGPRVIEQTIRKKLPEGFQRSEFLLEHGMLDKVVSRAEMRQVLSDLLSLLGKNCS